MLTHIETKWTKAGWWFQPLWKILVSWGYYIWKHVPNHQAVNKGVAKDTTVILELLDRLSKRNSGIFFTQQYTVMAASPWSHQKGARGDSNMFGLWSFNTLLWAACVEHCYNMLWDVAIYCQCLLFTLVRWFTYQHFVFKALLPEDHIGRVTWGPSLQQAQFFEFWQGK